MPGISLRYGARRSPTRLGKGAPAKSIYFTCLRMSSRELESAQRSSMREGGIEELSTAACRIISATVSAVGGSIEAGPMTMTVERKTVICRANSMPINCQKHERRACLSWVFRSEDLENNAHGEWAKVCKIAPWWSGFPTTPLHLRPASCGLRRARSWGSCRTKVAWADLGAIQFQALLVY